MMRKLTMEEVEEFASRPGVKRIAVVNFLSTVHNNDDIVVALKNLVLDAGLYSWNRKTVSVIADGIFLAGGLE